MEALFQKQLKFREINFAEATKSKLDLENHPTANSLMAAPAPNIRLLLVLRTDKLAACERLLSRALNRHSACRQVGQHIINAGRGIDIHLLSGALF